MKSRKYNFQSILIKRRKRRKSYPEVETLSVNKLNRNHLTDLFIKRHKSKENPVFKNS